MLLSENSPLHFIKSNSIHIATKSLNLSENSGQPANTYKQFTPETSNLARNRNILIKLKDSSWKNK